AGLEPGVHESTIRRRVHLHRYERHGCRAFLSGATVTGWPTDARRKRRKAALFFGQYISLQPQKDFAAIEKVRQPQRERKADHSNYQFAIVAQASLDIAA